MIIARIQDHLEAIYAIRCFARAADFLVNDEQASGLGATGRTAEELLVADGEGGLEVALYYAPELLSQVRPYEAQGLTRAMEDAWAAYCQVAEGVSHFVYLAHVAEREQRVSLLELEVQGEIDKFATCVLQRWSVSAEGYAQGLHRQLFDQVSYLAGLEHHERARYQEANRLARNYCLRLLVHVSARRMDRLLSELRYSYRLGAEAKLHYLARAA
ncbi:MAG TPA: hypothetical protein VEY30_00555 [Myxococcaceae bacterium]|nr:hypothetical protein [Myxococcaceae bacterium]